MESNFSHVSENDVETDTDKKRAEDVALLQGRSQQYVYFWICFRYVFVTFISSRVKRSVIYLF